MFSSHESPTQARPYSSRLIHSRASPPTGFHSCATDIVGRGLELDLAYRAVGVGDALSASSNAALQAFVISRMKLNGMWLPTSSLMIARPKAIRCQASVVSTTVITPIAMVTIPTAPCSARLAQVSERADTAIGSAITVDSAPMPIIDPMPNRTI
jgi:hypothetical protein